MALARACALIKAGFFASLRCLALRCILPPMSSCKAPLLQIHHRELVEELLALATPEERLSWLMERAPIHPPLSDDDLVSSRKVPGCLSGLWLKAETRDGLCCFGAHSDSSLVHGVASFICDLYSARTAEEIQTIGSSLADGLGLDGLLSMPRKRALSSTISFITHYAVQKEHHAFSTTPAAA
jgi:sulfur transfer protein SufE